MIRKALRTVLIPAVCFLVIAPVCMGRQKGAAHPEHSRKQLKHRWFFSFGYRRNRKDVEKIKFRNIRVTILNPPSAKPTPATAK